jgi:hypothetical protein
MEAKATATPAPIIGPTRPAIVIAAATIIATMAPIVAAAPIAPPPPAPSGARRCGGRRQRQTGKASNAKGACRHGANRGRRIHGQHGSHGGAADNTAFDGTAEAQRCLGQVWQSAFAPHHATLLHTAPPTGTSKGTVAARSHSRPCPRTPVWRPVVWWPVVSRPEVATIRALQGHVKRSTQLSYVDSYLVATRCCRNPILPNLVLQRGKPGAVPRASTFTAGVVIFTRQSHLLRRIVQARFF